MSERPRVRPGRISGGVVFLSLALFGVGVAVVLAGFNGLAGGGMETGRAIGALAMGGVVMALGIGLAVGAERALRRDEAKRPAIAPAAAAPPPKPRPKRSPVRRDEVLGQWTLAPDEWRAYREGEAREQRRDLLNNTVAGGMAGLFATWIFAGGWTYAPLGALGGAAAMLLGTLAAISSGRKRAAKNGATVVIRGGAVEIDGATTELGGDGGWLSAVRLREDLPLHALEIEIRRGAADPRSRTRRVTGEVIRIPVPRGREADAARIAERLRGAIPDGDPAPPAG